MIKIEIDLPDNTKAEIIYDGFNVTMPDGIFLFTNELKASFDYIIKMLELNNGTEFAKQI